MKKLKNNYNFKEETKLLGEMSVKLICMRQLLFLEIDRKDEIKRKDRILKESTICKDDEEWAYDMVLDRINEEINTISNQMSRWQIRLDTLNGKKINKMNIDLDAIKMIPIERVMDRGPTMRSTGRKFYKCIFHEERTGSMCWYENDKHFYSFCCQEHGSIIDIYMKLNNCSFAESIKYLNEINY